ncbi:Glutathione S-transferase 1:-like isoform C [Dinothrombium tinctorium]|uniref:Glutathione S-transferase 1:-like isoform C n=1 Tax=Dinothrombium tinctorium TaxID=1965070 RepID=A0A3S3NPJ5_9ACAR|nr:Glutathione S-transferase 1:-like isoform C [Dinothrombium tinctorium]
MPIDLYDCLDSPPCLAVRLTLQYLKISFNLRNTNIEASEHLTPEFLKLNPAHIIPTINDNGFVLWESRTINRYLANQYSPDTDLYPNDPQKRAIVDRMLDFDLGSLFPSAFDWMLAPIFEQKPRDEEKEKAMSEKLQLLDHFLSEAGYVAGDHLTIADFSVLASVISIYSAGHNMDQYKNINSWLNRLENELPFYKQSIDPYVEACDVWFASYKK